ncbi:MAG: lipoate--protein ligase family protein [Ottowia sp.]|nr:lipoate--protein ligase family protein [Ottowia sp.]
MKRTTWSDYDWQLVHEPPQAPSLHVALDEVLLDAVASGQRAPTLRVWEWELPCVVIGRFQSLSNEVDAEAAQALGINVVRRISGGGAMFMEGGNCVTYSIYAPEALVAGMTFQQSYGFFDQWALDALARVGVRAWYEPLNDITSDKGKIAGSAQARRGGAVLHHTTMAYDIDAEKMLKVLRIGREKMSDKGTPSAAKRVDPLRSQTGLARDAIIATMAETFRQAHGLAPGTLTAGELERARALVASKFGTAAWTAAVP